MRYIGVDVGKNRCQACIMDEDGEILGEFSFTNTWEGIQALLEKTGDTKSKAVVESTGNLWLRIYEALEDHGVEVKLANPYKTKAIASARIKTDKLSARILAHLLRADLIPESYVPPREIRELRDMVRRRSFLVGMRTMLKNRIRAELAKRAIRPGRPLWSREGRELLRDLGLEAVDQVLPVMAALDKQIAHMSLDLRRMCGEDPRARLLTTIPGVGYYIAVLWWPRSVMYGVSLTRRSSAATLAWFPR